MSLFAITGVILLSSTGKVAEDKGFGSCFKESNNPSNLEFLSTLIAVSSVEN